MKTLYVWKQRYEEEERRRRNEDMWHVAVCMRNVG